MKHYPLRMTDSMVRAVLAGTKTQHRIPCGLDKDTGIESISHVGGINQPRYWSVFSSLYPIYTVRCPFGQAGDRLWVRECHYIKPDGDVIYRADFPSTSILLGNWNPSIFCKRIHSRILLEVLSIKAHSLLAITAQDMQAEGTSAADSSSGFPSELARLYKFQINTWVWAATFRRLA